MIKNPLAYLNYSDPFVTFDKKTNFYYLAASNPNNNTLTLFRSRKIGNILKDGESKIVYQSGSNNTYGPMWAPEMLKVGNHWYIYTNYQEKYNECPFGERKHILVLKSKTEDPFDGFEFGSKPDQIRFAIDPTSAFINGVQYICYSIVDEGIQKLEIREMSDPLTFTDHLGIIAKAEYDWEKVKGYETYTLNEGPFFVKNNERLFIIYSANGCWSDDYCLGVLEYMGGDICDKNSWKKYDKPLFIKGNGVYGVGHASFFYSPDGKELWCAYHCLCHSDPNIEELDRYTCVQRVYFDETGFPIMESPIEFEKEFNDPSGEK